MQARPGGRVKRGRKPIAGFDGRDESLLIGKHGFQPQFAEQRVPRREAVIERALGAFMRCVMESTVTAPGPRSQANARAAARKPALSNSARPIDIDYLV
jgi:hypothetical protein